MTSAFSQRVSAARVAWLSGGAGGRQSVDVVVKPLAGWRWLGESGVWRIEPRTSKCLSLLAVVSGPGAIEACYPSTANGTANALREEGWPQKMMGPESIRASRLNIHVYKRNACTGPTRAGGANRDRGTLGNGKSQSVERTAARQRRIRTGLRDQLDRGTRCVAPLSMFTAEGARLKVMRFYSLA